MERTHPTPAQPTPEAERVAALHREAAAAYAAANTATARAEARIQLGLARTHANGQAATR